MRAKKRSNTSEDRAGQTFCYLTSNAKLSRFGALLHSSEDNEAVIKMMMNSRSPTMRHVSRTHRVALDWPFDRINLDPKIQNKDLDTKNQPADILTKSNFTREEWNHLLLLLNIMSFFDVLQQPFQHRWNEFVPSQCDHITQQRRVPGEGPPHTHYGKSPTGRQNEADGDET